MSDRRPGTGPGPRATLDQNRSTIWRGCECMRQQGLQAALCDAPRSGRPRGQFQQEHRNRDDRPFQQSPGPLIAREPFGGEMPYGNDEAGWRSRRRYRHKCSWLWGGFMGRCRRNSTPKANTGRPAAATRAGSRTPTSSARRRPAPPNSRWPGGASTPPTCGRRHNRRAAPRWPASPPEKTRTTTPSTVAPPSHTFTFTGTLPPMRPV